MQALTDSELSGDEQEENASRLAIESNVWDWELDYYVSGAMHSIYHPIRLINKHGQPPRPPPPQLLNVPPPPRVSPPRRRINSMESSVCNLGECVPLWPASHPSNYDLLRLVRGDRGDQLDLSETHIGLSCICLSSVTSPSCLFSLLSPRNKTRTRRLFG